MNNLKKHYINPQDLIEYLYEADAINGRTAKLINKFPEEDVVKVVRCRECYFRGLDGTDAPVCTGAMAYSYTPDDWFCAAGKPKDGGQEE